MIFTVIKVVIASIESDSLRIQNPRLMHNADLEMIKPSYKPIEYINHGNKSVVFKVVDGDQKSYALKTTVIKNNLIYNIEQELLRELDHPNIIKMYAYTKEIVAFNKLPNFLKIECLNDDLIYQLESEEFNSELERKLLVNKINEDNREFSDSFINNIARNLIIYKRGEMLFKIRNDFETYDYFEFNTNSDQKTIKNDKKKPGIKLNETLKFPMAEDKCPTENTDAILSLTILEYLPYRANKDFLPICVQSLFKQVLSGLKYLNENKIVHGNIKPDNILFDQFGTIKIGGFSSAYIEGGDCKLTANNSLFDAPEIVNGCNEITTKVDVWSAAITLIKIINLPEEILEKLILNSYQNIENFSLDESFDQSAKETLSLFNLLGKMLRKDPKERWSAEQCLNHKFIQN
ncbi:hypothetical protein NUSPORA_01848 [Nucleospora cyclopteri]